MELDETRELLKVLLFELVKDSVFLNIFGVLTQTLHNTRDMLLKLTQLLSLLPLTTPTHEQREHKLQTTSIDQLHCIPWTSLQRKRQHLHS